LYLNHGDPVHLGSLLLGLGGIIFFTLLNYWGMKSAMKFQEVLICGLVIFSLIFIGTGIIRGHTNNLEPLFSKMGTESAVRSVLMVLITVPLWLGGFNIIPQVMEEKAEGASLKMVGKVILLAIGGAAIFYLLVILSASMSSPWKGLLTLDLPAYGAFLAAFKSPIFAKTVLFAGLCGIISVWNTLFIASSRILFALGRGRIIPSAFGRVHPRFKSPWVAVLFVGAVGFVGVFVGKKALVPIVNMGAFCFALAYLVSCLGVIKLRLSQPDRRRPYKLPGGIATAATGALVALGMLLYSLYQPYVNAKGSLPLEWASILIWAVLGALFWVYARKYRNRLSEEERRRFILGSEAHTRSEETL
jgi:amino acid transporter